MRLVTGVNAFGFAAALTALFIVGCSKRPHQWSEPSTRYDPLRGSCGEGPERELLARQRQADFEVAKLDAGSADWSVYAHHPNGYVRAMSLLRLRNRMHEASDAELRRVAELLTDGSAIYSAECASLLASCEQGQGLDMHRGLCQKNAQTVGGLADELLSLAPPERVVLALTLTPLGNAEATILSVVAPSLASKDALESGLAAVAIVRLTDRTGAEAAPVNDEPRKGAIRLLEAQVRAGKAAADLSSLGSAGTVLLDAILTRIEPARSKPELVSSALREVSWVASMGPRASRAAAALFELAGALAARRDSLRARSPFESRGSSLRPSSWGSAAEPGRAGRLTTWGRGALHHPASSARIRRILGRLLCGERSAFGARGHCPRRAVPPVPALNLGRNLVPGDRSGRPTH